MQPDPRLRQQGLQPNSVSDASTSPCLHANEIGCSDAVILLSRGSADPPGPGSWRRHPCRFEKIGFSLIEDVLDPLAWEVIDWSALPHDVIPLKSRTEP